MTRRSQEATRLLAGFAFLVVGTSLMFGVTVAVGVVMTVVGIAMLANAE